MADADEVQTPRTKKASVFKSGGAKKRREQEQNAATAVLGKAKEIAKGLKCTESMANKVVEALHPGKFSAVELGKLSTDELEKAVADLVELEQEKANKGLGALMSGDQANTIQQLQSIMDDQGLKDIINKVSGSRSGAVPAITEIARAQIEKVIKEEDLFIKFTTMLKLQITVVELRRLFYWVSALEIVLMLLGAVFFVPFLLHDQTQVYLYLALSTHWIRAFIGFKVMKTFGKFEQWFLSAVDQGSQGGPMEAVIKNYDPKSHYLLTYIFITIFTLIVDLGVLGWLIKIYGEDDSSSALLADLYLLVMCISMLAMDLFLFIWMPSAYMRLSPELQKYVGKRISAKCPCCKCWFVDDDDVDIQDDIEEGRSGGSSLAKQDAEVGGALAEAAKDESSL